MSQLQKSEIVGAIERSVGSVPNNEVQRFLNLQQPIPNLFVVGAAKAGTTSIHAYLARHPEVFMSDLKEPHFFASFEMSPEFDNFMPVIRDGAAYQKLFHGSEGFKVVGESSPSYLCDPLSAIRIKKAVPQAKIVISLRNPVERAHSHYLMEYRQGREIWPFMEAIKADSRRTSKGWGVSFQYIEQGLYAEQVRRFVDAFGRDKVLVVLFEDLTSKTAEVMQEVATFLEIDPSTFPKSAFERIHNQFEVSRGGIARILLRTRPLRLWSKRLLPKVVRTKIRNRFLFTNGKKPLIDEVTRQDLAGLFAADIDRLESLLNRDFSKLR